VERDILLSRAHLQAGDAARALALARGAQEQIITSPARGQFPALEAEASVQLAHAQLASGDATNARAYAERALALRRELSHPSSPWLAEAHLALADAQLASGETARARDNVARARAALSAQGDVSDQFRQPLLALARRISN
ncbi:MAG TPA: tetratricopeptide repeat protein, partial [Burkholderiaceae bacterium]|nr:tetratricopeptide repeat protein [Burkholderiaceae bacterium]